MRRIILLLTTILFFAVQSEAQSSKMLTLTCDCEEWAAYTCNNCPEEAEFGNGIIINKGGRNIKKLYAPVMIEGITSGNQFTLKDVNGETYTDRLSNMGISRDSLKSFLKECNMGEIEDRGINQTFVLNGSTLTITDDVVSLDVDVSPLLDNTDDQQITNFQLIGQNLSITLEAGGTATVDLSSLLSSITPNADGTYTHTSNGNTQVIGYQLSLNAAGDELSILNSQGSVVNTVSLASGNTSSFSDLSSGTSIGSQHNDGTGNTYDITIDTIDGGAGNPNTLEFVFGGNTMNIPYCPDCGGAEIEAFNGTSIQNDNVQWGDNNPGQSEPGVLVNHRYMNMNTFHQSWIGIDNDIDHRVLRLTATGDIWFNGSTVTNTDEFALWFKLGGRSFDVSFNTPANRALLGLDAVNFGRDGISSSSSTWNSGFNGQATAFYARNTARNGIASGWYSNNQAFGGEISSYAGTQLGTHPVIFTGQSANTTVETNLLYALGNARHAGATANRSNAHTVLKNGFTQIAADGAVPFPIAKTQAQVTPLAGLHVQTVWNNRAYTGVLLAPMTQSQRNGIPAANLVDGLEIYCTDCVANDTTTGVKQVYQASTTTWKNLY